MQASQVHRHTHRSPLSADFGQSPKAEAAEAQHLLDPTEHGLGNGLAPSIMLTTGWRAQTLRHAKGGWQSVLDRTREYPESLQSRPLDPLYALVFFDALRVKMRDEGAARNKAGIPGDRRDAGGLQR